MFPTKETNGIWAWQLELANGQLLNRILFAHSSPLRLPRSNNHFFTLHNKITNKDQTKYFNNLYVYTAIILKVQPKDLNS